MKNFRVFLSENVQFLEVRFFYIQYLNRHDFVMGIFTGRILDSQGCQNVRMRRLICVFVGRTYQKVRYFHVATRIN